MVNPWVEPWKRSDKTKSLIDFKNEWIAQASQEELQALGLESEEVEQKPQESITHTPSKEEPFVTKTLDVRDKIIGSRINKELYRDLEIYAYRNGMRISECVYRIVQAHITRWKA